MWCVIELRKIKNDINVTRMANSFVFTFQLVIFAMLFDHCKYRLIQSIRMNYCNVNFSNLSIKLNVINKHEILSDDASTDYYMSFQKDGKMSNSTWAAYTGEIKDVM